MFKKADLKIPRPFVPHKIKTDPENWVILDPIDWSKKTIVEIGCGKAEWIFDEAKNNPDINYLAIERTQNKSRVLEESNKKEKLANLYSIRADAISLLTNKAPDATIDELIFFYPNPTPKKKQANQRFFVGSCFHLFKQKLKPKGSIYLATNIEDYAKEAEIFLREIWDFEIERSGPITNLAKPRSPFERKYHERGEGLFEVFARKI